MDIALKLAAVLEYGVLILLVGLSVWSIAIMIDRKRVLSRQTSADELLFLRELISRGDTAAIAGWIEQHPGIHSSTLKAANRVREPLLVDREVRSYLTDQRLNLEKGLPVLATLGANTPFIGLFGTVLGIIRSFAALGESSGAATTVMSGISQALLATAAGLFVAIPAVIAFNAFSNRLRTLLSQCESLKDLYVAHSSAREQR
jgi:biopolymer transport protein ExbB/TolQ